MNRWSLFVRGGSLCLGVLPLAMWLWHTEQRERGPRACSSEGELEPVQFLGSRRGFCFQEIGRAPFHHVSKKSQYLPREKGFVQKTVFIEEED